MKAGFNLANLTVSNKTSIQTFSSHPSFNAGGLASIPLFGDFKLQPEIIFSGQGTKYTNDGDVYKYNLGYISVPVLFKYQHHSGFFAEIGPQVSLLAVSKGKYLGTTVDIKDQFKSTDVSGVLGIGYLSAFNLGIDARYNLGLTNVLKESGDQTAKNAVSQIGIFYMFGSKK